MNKLSAAVLVVALSTTLSSCALIERLTYKPSPIQTLEKAPKLDVKNFFNGDIEAFAIVQDNTGKITGSFTAKINGKWDDNKGVWQQNFVYENGKKDSRTWLVTLDSNGDFSAVGHDVVTPGKGKQLGNAMQMLYSLSVMQNGQKQVVDYEDNFYLVDERSAIAISSIRTDHIPSGKAIISFKKISKSE